TRAGGGGGGQSTGRCGRAGGTVVAGRRLRGPTAGAGLGAGGGRWAAAGGPGCPGRPVAGVGDRTGDGRRGRCGGGKPIRPGSAAPAGGTRGTGTREPRGGTGVDCRGATPRF